MAMRTHQDIVTSFGASALARALNDRGVTLAPNTPQRWGERGSIPVQYWPHLVDIGAAELAELIAGAPQRKRRDAA